ncbi:hypothetical protein MHBO_000151 [Bonamia ostreae]|uniref:Uncharacterized protein n=1 Tax=Bonamia ostreae TaxID=126728 RepID=A0ABV2AEP2_9EUKA
MKRKENEIENKKGEIEISERLKMENEEQTENLKKKLILQKQIVDDQETKLSEQINNKENLEKKLKAKDKELSRIEKEVASFIVNKRHSINEKKSKIDNFAKIAKSIQSKTKLVFDMNDNLKEQLRTIQKLKKHLEKTVCYSNSVTNNRLE